ncbi:MAG: hypothetical protein NTZ45_01735 [Methylococcales bacterium]|nr:hypothetical protein [Methylococcales bacterium]
METLFNKSAIRVGIDTIKIKLRMSIFKSEPTNQLIEKLKSSFDPDEISIFQKGDYHYLKQNDSNCYLSKIHKTGTDRYTIEIFGMCQTITNFKLTEYHATILSIIGNLTGDIEMTLEKMDVALDFFYPHDRSFVFDGSKRSDFLDMINYQSKLSFVHLTKIPMTTIRVPKRQKRIIKFALNHKDIRSPEDKKSRDCYYRWVKPTSHYLNKVNYGKCEEDESSHFEIKINDREILYKISDFFDGSETFSSDYDHETETHIKKGSKKVSNIKYDKSKRDEDKHGCVQDVYNAIIKDMADTGEEHDDLIDDFKHTRVELRFFRPAVSTRETPLVINSESSYGELLDCIKKEIEKMTIFILKPDISTDDYLDVYKKRFKKVTVTRAITSSDYGRTLEVTPDAWNDFENQIDVLKSKFIPDVTPSISNNPIRRIIHRVGGRS